MGFFSGLAKIAGGVLGGPLGAAAVNVAGDLFSQSNAREAFRTRYQDTVADMRAAGLNPALAYGQGGGNPQTMSFGDWGSSAAQAAQAISAANNAKAETALKEAQANILRAQTNDLIASARLRNELTGKQIESTDSTTTLNTARENLYTLDYQRARKTFQSDIDAQIAANLQQMLQTPEARARAKYYTQLGPGAFYLNNAVDLAKAGAQLYGSRGLNKPRTTNIYPRR